GRVRGSVLRRELRAGHGAPLEKPVSQPPQKQNSNERPVKKRHSHVGLHLPVVMNHPANRRQVDAAMNDLPASATEAADPPGGGSYRHGKEEQEAQKAHGNERPLRYILRD